MVKWARVAARVGARVGARFGTLGRRPRRALVVAAVLAAVLVTLRLLPAAPLSQIAPHSTAIHAQGGELLRLSLASDDQFRLWVPLDQMAPALPEAVLLYEDRWYYWHPGVNPFALVRSAFATWFGGNRQGGSTITMQLARRVYGIDSRSVRGKLKQIAAALWLEARYSKRAILEAYLNYAPYGGNIEGAGAASLVYFHQRVHDLALPEALALAVIPQNPRKRLVAGRAEAGAAPTPPDALLAARDRVFAAWVARHPADAHFAADLRLPLKVYGIAELPFRAPHLCDALIAAGNTGEVRAALDLRMQDTLERIISQTIEHERNVGIRNAAAMLVDASTMEVKAVVGSADWHDAGIDGQVNGTTAKRSPGSTLKPFIYALAIDQGVLHPMTILKDAPTAFGPFSPENFDGRFVGPITAQEALVRSRNVPAVAVAAKLKAPSLYEFLRSAGVTRMASESHYGLALSLGGGEITMEELVRLYAMLANRGVMHGLHYRAQSNGKQRDAMDDAGFEAEGARLLSEEAAFITIDMLRNNPRPDTGTPSRLPVAWKTGTSWGFHDAWSAGVFGRMVLVVWVGNFDNTANPGFVGVKAAAPLYFRIVDALRSQGLDPGEMAFRAPQNLARVEVCAASGDLPNAWCPQRATTWFIPGKSPIRVSTLHRPVLIDTRTGQAVCTPSPTTREEVFEFWPSDLMRVFREAGMPRRAPPPLPDCARAPDAPAAAPQIVTPLRGVTYTMRLSKPEAIALRAHDANGGAVFWFVDQGFLGQVKAGEAIAWHPDHGGRFVLRAVNENGASDAREVKVEFEP